MKRRQEYTLISSIKYNNLKMIKVIYKLTEGIRFTKIEKNDVGTKIIIETFI